MLQNKFRTSLLLVLLAVFFTREIHAASRDKDNDNKLTIVRSKPEQHTNTPSSNQGSPTHPPSSKPGPTTSPSSSLKPELQISSSSSGPPKKLYSQWIWAAMLLSDKFLAPLRVASVPNSCKWIAESDDTLRSDVDSIKPPLIPDKRETIKAMIIDEVIEGLRSNVEDTVDTIIKTEKKRFLASWQQSVGKAWGDMLAKSYDQTTLPKSLASYTPRKIRNAFEALRTRHRTVYDEFLRNFNQIVDDFTEKYKSDLNNALFESAKRYLLKPVPFNPSVKSLMHESIAEKLKPSSIVVKTELGKWVLNHARHLHGHVINDMGLVVHKNFDNIKPRVENFVLDSVRKAIKSTFAEETLKKYPAIDKVAEAVSLKAFSLMTPALNRYLQTLKEDLMIENSKMLWRGLRKNIKFIDKGCDLTQSMMTPESYADLNKEIFTWDKVKKQRLPMLSDL